ncbi:unnamed protein product [Calypogeia fissa]
MAESMAEWVVWVCSQVRGRQGKEGGSVLHYSVEYNVRAPDRNHGIPALLHFTAAAAVDWAAEVPDSQLVLLDFARANALLDM